MNENLERIIEYLRSKHRELLSMPPKTFQNLPPDTPTGGVYLFSDGSRHMYVGRTKKEIHVRLKEHIGEADDCPFAVQLAKDAISETDPKAGNKTLKHLRQD